MFKKIGAALGPFDLAAIPIAAYGSPVEEWFHKKNHMNAEESVLTHIDLKSAHSVSIHWGTFQLTSEPILEPPQRVSAALQANGLESDAFVSLKHGETRDWPILGESPSLGTVSRNSKFVGQQPVRGSTKPGVVVQYV